MSDGVLYVEIMPSTKGIGKAVERDASSAFAGAEKTGTSFFQRLGGWAKAGAIAVGGMVAAVGALAIGGGISRALNIEDAQAKLKGLGHDTKSIEAIMTNALAAVKGTAFGLDAAATTAAAAVASGIKPGQELERYLRLTADAATIAGVSMEEMGSIINKVQAKGKAQMEDLNRLTERGVPILQMLADEYGVTAEEMSKMVSRGEVDAARFRKALEDNVGGAALASGDTTRGAFANMRAAMSRFGEALVGEGLGAAKTFFNEVGVIFDGLTSRITPVVEKIQEKLGGMFQVDGMGERFLGWLDRTVGAIASGPIPQLVAALAPVLPVLGEAARLIGEALSQAFFELGEALAPVLPEVAQSLADAVVELAPALADLLVALLPVIPPLAELLAAVAPLAGDLLTLLLPVLEAMITLLTDNARMLEIFVGWLSGDLSEFGLIVAISEMTGPLGDLLWWLGQVSAGFGDWVRSVRDGLAAAVSLVSAGMAQVRRFFVDTWNNIVTSVSTAVTRVVTFVQQLPGKVMSAVSSFKTLLVQAGKDLIQGLINGVSSMITNAVNSVKNVGGQMLDGVKSFLGIQSPSRRFRDEVGKMVGLGLLAGVEDEAIRGRIDTAVSHLVDVPSVAVSGGGGFPDQVTLVDRDGSILALLDVLLNSAFSGASSAALSSRLGTLVAR